MVCRLAGAKPLSESMLLIGPLEINFSEILIEILIFFIHVNAFEITVWKMAVILSRPRCVNLLPVWLLQEPGIRYNNHRAFCMGFKTGPRFNIRQHILLRGCMKCGNHDIESLIYRNTSKFDRQCSRGASQIASWQDNWLKIIIPWRLDIDRSHNETSYCINTSAPRLLTHWTLLVVEGLLQAHFASFFTN